jgi:hypothetical protein
MGSLKKKEEIAGTNRKKVNIGIEKKQSKPATAIHKM